MTWFDLLVLLLGTAVVIAKMREEAGRNFMDALAALAALRLAAEYGPPLTRALGWQAMADTGASPVATAVCFAGCLAIGMAISRFLHQRTRWTLDTLDPVAGVICGLAIAVVVGHVLADTSARLAVLNSGSLPEYLTRSSVADELRSFRACYQVLDLLTR